MPQEKASELLRGQTRAEVLACAGAPFREARDGEMQVMSYSSLRAISDVGLIQCELSVVLRNDAVEAVRYSGRQTLYQANTCASILHACRK